MENVNSSLSKIRFVQISGIPEQRVMQDLLKLYVLFFGNAREAMFKSRIQKHSGVLALLAYQEDIPVGFKVGYQLDNHTYYSWVGGVKKTHRNIGIASRLASLQESWVKKQGYSLLRTKSMNRFKPMMIFNLKNGFDITEVYKTSSGDIKIVFEKRF